MQPVRATASDFAQLRAAAAEAVAVAQSKLPLLEAAQRTASQAREPAAEAERHWQELHGRLTALQREAQEATKQLRTSVTAAAGGEAGATHALLQVHVKERLEDYRLNHGLTNCSEWKVGAEGGGAGAMHARAATGPEARRVCVHQADSQLHAALAPCLSSPLPCSPAGLPAAGPAAAQHPGRAHAVPGRGVRVRGPAVCRRGAGHRQPLPL